MLQEPNLLMGGFLSPDPGRRQSDRLNNLHIAGAAAIVVLQSLDYLLLGGIGVLVQQRLGRQHHARRTEAALDGAHIQKCLLDGMETAVLPFSPSMVRISAPSTRDILVMQERMGRPFISTVQAPQ